MIPMTFETLQILGKLLDCLLFAGGLVLAALIAKAVLG